MTFRANQAFYWLKLKDDFFDSEDIKYIEKMDNGNGMLYCYFYLKLCVKSLKKNGVLIISVGETLVPYDEVALANLTDMPVDIVRGALALFRKFKIITVLEHGELYLPQVSEMVGSETKGASRVRIHREKEQEQEQVLQCNDTVTPMKQICNDTVTPMKQTLHCYDTVTIAEQICNDTVTPMKQICNIKINKETELEKKQEKALHCNSTVIQMQKICNTEKEKEKEKEIEKEKETKNNINSNKQMDFKEFEFHLFMTGDEATDKSRKASLLRVLRRNINFATGAGTNYKDFVVSMQSHLHNQHKQNIDVFAAIDNSISGGIKTIIAPKDVSNKTNTLAVYDKKKQMRQIILQQCSTLEYSIAVDKLRQCNSFNWFPLSKLEDAITKSECQQYRIKYPTLSFFKAKQQACQEMLMRIGFMKEDFIL